MRTGFVLLSMLLLTTVSGAFAAERPTTPLKTEGTIAGADYRIEIPADWNGGLVMYAHGYVMASQTPMFSDPLSAAFQRVGYAVAQSKFSRQGWAAREGILDTEALRRLFVDTYGPAFPTIIAGHSQGAAITYATIERFPEAYDGALPMCGAGGSALDFMKSRIFDMRVLFDYHFPGLAGSAVDFPDGAKTAATVSMKAKKLVEADPAKAEAFARLVNISSAGEIPNVIAFWSEILRELTERTGGNAFDNRNTIYAGTEDDARLNREIPRYTADPKSVEYLRQWVSTSGAISDPVYALHTLVDDLIPPGLANLYNEKTVQAGTSALYVMSYVEHSGHCNFTPGEMERALRELDGWIRSGNRPDAKNLTTP